jgi:Kef-type K+ transport system membrane component KefB
MNLTIEIGLLIIISSIIAMLLHKLKIPPLISYVFTGIIASYFHLKLDENSINFMIELGIILLLFLAGLNIKLKNLFKLGKITLIIGEGHDLIMGGIGFIIAYFIMGLNTIASFYLAIGLTLSSTIVIMRALTNRKELASPHGKILLGTMILQNILAMSALAIFSTLEDSTSISYNLLLLLWKSSVIFFTLLIMGKYLLPRIFNYAAKSTELIYLIALAWCFTGVTLSGFFNFSLSIGAFIAGMVIADLPFSFEIIDKAKGLRDFGILIFFLSVGLKLQITKAILLNWHFYLLLCFVLFSTPIIFASITSFLKFTKKEIFIMSVIPAQMSEFTLILITFGLTINHISIELYSMITLIILITIMTSSWFIENLNKIYKKFEHKLDFLEWYHIQKPVNKTKDLKNHVAILGFGKLGQYIAKYYIKKKIDVVVVDWRPELIKTARTLKCIIVYGDAGDSDLWEEIKLNKAQTIISTIGQNQEDDLALLKWLRKNNHKILKIVETNVPKDGRELYKNGADIVLFHDKLEWNYLKKHLSIKNKKKLPNLFKI